MSQRTLDLLEEIKIIVERESCGWEHEEAILKIEGITAHLKWQIFEPTLVQKVDSILSWSRILYSNQSDGGWDGGATLLKSYVLEDVSQAINQVSGAMEAA